MAKVKKAFFCTNCGHQHAQWQGQCSSCKAWNTLQEEVLEKPKTTATWQDSGTAQKSKPVRIQDVAVDAIARMSSGDVELNRVLGGGIVPGSMVLVGGEPGIGKSTLLLQVAHAIKGKVVYVSGEESEQQIKLRSARVTEESSECFLLTETNTQSLLHHLGTLKPALVVIDSIQTLHSSMLDSTAGSVPQIRACTAELIQFAKNTHTPVFLVGHITKDGAIAGPKVLEHMVDTVLHFEGDRNHVYRILRAHKNRFGTTAELGIYTMAQEGLMAVTNPSALLISNESAGLSGHAIGATVEGIRPMLIEVQALVSSAVYGTPQRSSTGFDNKRLNMLLAVLEKRAGFQLGAKDVFLNLAGGIRLDDPSLDLAVMVAILSSSLDVAIPKGYTFAAEVGLSGELRNVPKMEQRMQEATKLGFERMVVAQAVKTVPQGLEVIRLATIQDLVTHLF
ncbi:MAG: DNA repair protein RadA [Flavobacteriaceae bacterium]|jgi:DNA repair protein RadA/Sms|nr:DNA repair protein RadA [Flavobacteriaceae bacterium]